MPDSVGCPSAAAARFGISVGRTGEEVVSATGLPMRWMTCAPTGETKAPAVMSENAREASRRMRSGNGEVSRRVSRREIVASQVKTNRVSRSLSRARAQRHPRPLPYPSRCAIVREPSSPRRRRCPPMSIAAHFRMIKLKDVYKSFGNKKVLQGFSLDVMEGETMVDHRLLRNREVGGHQAHRRSARARLGHRVRR